MEKLQGTDCSQKSTKQTGCSPDGETKSHQRCICYGERVGMTKPKNALPTCWNLQFRWTCHIKVTQNWNHENTTRLKFRTSIHCVSPYFFHILLEQKCHWLQGNESVLLSTVEHVVEKAVSAATSNLGQLIEEKMATQAVGKGCVFINVHGNLMAPSQATPLQQIRPY